jgi:FkbH-like protein
MTGMAITSGQIYEALRPLLGGKGRIVVLHSSLYPFRLGEAELKWPLLRAISQLVEEGFSFAIPTFSFEFCRTGRFDPIRTTSESGQLGDFALELAAFRRTGQPIYSFAVAGPRAGEILACPSSTTFSSDSPFGLFDRDNARIVMFGSGWKSCTQFHFYEEEAQVPYRAYKIFEPAAESSQAQPARMYVRDLAIDAQNNFSLAERRIREAGAIADAALGEARIEATDCSALATTCRSLLTDDPFAFVTEPAGVRRRIAQIAEREKQKPVRLAVLGSSNVDTLALRLKDRLGTLIPDRQIEVYTAGYGQAVSEALTPGSGLDRFKPEFTLFLDRPEDLYQTASVSDAAVANRDALDTYLDAISASGKRLGAHVFAANFVAQQLPGETPARSGRGAALHQFIAAANEELSQRLEQLPSGHLIDVAGLASTLSARVSDERLWFLGRIPFSDAFAERLVDRAAGLVLAALGRTVRLLVLDLDNTLWGGVLGEDGIEGLALGGDFPGNAYRHFQDVLKRLSGRGIALAIVSKNDEAEALQAIKGLPGMAIREEDVAAWRIGWNDKTDSVRDIAAELSLGLESIAFIDDNPAERMRMRMTLPEVKVIDLPEDPVGYASAVLESPWLACLELTAEDRKRTKSYVQRRQMTTERSRFSDERTFLRHLQPRVHIGRRDAGNNHRTQQLIAKTNQFNTTGRRFSPAEISAYEQHGGCFYVLGLEDRFSEFENIGVIAVDWGRPGSRRAIIDPFLLSCRILGRGVELAVLAWVAGEARARSVTELMGKIIETPRNEPARNIYRDYGFAPGPAAGEWVLDLTKARLQVPEWVEIRDRTGALADV